MNPSLKLIAWVLALIGITLFQAGTFMVRMVVADKIWQLV